MADTLPESPSGPAIASVERGADNVEEQTNVKAATMTKARRYMVGATGVLVGALLSVGGQTMRAIPAHAATASGAFECQPGFYQVLDGQLKLLNPITGIYSNIGAKRDAYNAIGFNSKDGFLYGLSNAAASKGHLLKISNDGTATDLGTPTGLPEEKMYTGDFDANGNLVVRNGGDYYSINVTTKVATAVAVASGTPNGSDAAMINGVMYSVQATTLYRFNLTTRAVTTAEITGLDAQTTDVEKTFGAAWSDKDDNLYVANNGTGKIMKISGYTGSAPSASLVIEGEVPVVGTDGVNNDGASCKTAPAPFDPPSAANDAYQATAGTPLTKPAGDAIFKNDTGQGLTLERVTTQPTHGTLTVNDDGSFTYTPAAGYSGPDSFKYLAVDEWGRVTNEATVTITVKPVAKDDAYTLDRNADGPTNVDGLLKNDIGKGIEVTSNTDPAHGELTVDPNGGFKYLPEDGFDGVDTFNYTITDDAGQTATAKVTITVTADDTPDVQGTQVRRSDGSLADTGGRPQTLVLLGFVLVMLGGILTVITRRRIAS